MQDNKAKLIGLVVIALLAIGGTGAVIALNKQENGQSSETTTTPTQAQASETSEATSTTTAASSYKDGDYSADGSYRTPGGTESISVDLTLKDGTVTAVTVEGNGTGESAEYQSMFKQGISSQVVGKNIDELNISRVSGSSLTSTGFNNALDTIKQQASRHKLSFDAIGTRWSIETSQPLSGQLLTDLFVAIQNFDLKWSRCADSQVSTLRHTPDIIQLDTDEAAMWQLYRTLYDATDGAVSPLVGVSLEAAGYDADYSLVPADIPVVAPDWDATLTFTDTSLTVHIPATLDIGGAGKGLLVDRVAALLHTEISGYTIDAGGDIYTAGHTESVALEHPSDASLAIGVVQVADGALCGSSPNRRTWATTHHIVDARSGVATTHIAAVWSLADTTMRADMATTALFFLPLHDVERVIDCRPLVMTADGHIQYTHDKDIEIYA